MHQDSGKDFFVRTCIVWCQFVRVATVLAAFLYWGTTFSSPALAINIVIHHDTGDDDNPVWDSDGALLISTFEAAAQIWESYLPGSGQHDVDVKWDDDFTVLGQWNLDFEPFSHNNIRINPANLWYYDPTPFNHSEYDFTTQNASGSPRTFFGGTWHYRDLTPAEQTAGFYGTPPGMLEVGYRGRAATGSPQISRLDLLSTVIHELGHELGVNSVNLGPGWDFEQNWVGGVTGSGVRRTGGHLVSPSTLMCSGCGLTGTRRLPSATDILAVAEHHGHSTVDLARKEFLTGSDWHVGTNWVGGSIPSADDDAFIRNPDSLVTLGLSSTGRAQNLFLGERAWLSTNAHSLNIGSLTGGTITIDGDNNETTMFVNLSGDIQMGNMILQNQATLNMRGGEVVAYDQSINVSDNTSSIVGFGTVSLFGADKIINNGLIEPRGVLTLSAPFSGEFDLDGTSENGQIRVTQGNLVVNGPLVDPFNGTFSISGGRTATFDDGWEMAGVATVFTDSGAARINGNMVLSGMFTTMKDGVLHLTDQLITTPSANMQVEIRGLNVLHGTITYGGGTMNGSGKVSQEGDATVTANTTINVAFYELGGLGFLVGGEATTTILDGKTLTINSTVINTTTIAPGQFGGTLLIDGGSLVANIGGGAVDFILSDPTTPLELDADAMLTLRDNGLAIPSYRGSKLVVSENAMIHAENNAIIGTTAAEIRAPVRFENGEVMIDEQMELRLFEDNEFSGNTQFTGADGTLRLGNSSHSIVTGSPTIDPVLRIVGPIGTGLRTRLTVTSGGLLRISRQAEIVGTARLSVENGSAHIGNLFEGAELHITGSPLTLGGNVQQTSGGKLIVSDFNFATASAGFYVDALAGAHVTVEGGGLLETTITELAPLAIIPGMADITITGIGSRWENDGHLYIGGGPSGPGGDAELNINSGAAVVTGTHPGSQIHLYSEDQLNVIGASLTLGAGPEAGANQIRINAGAELLSEGGQIRIGGGIGDNGIATVESDHRLVLDDGFLETDKLIVLGALSGTGKISADVSAFSSATIQPGLPVRDLVIDGNLNTVGTNLIHIGGSNPSEYGQLFINHVADISGSTLQVQLSDLGGGTYQPLAGDTFNILISGAGIVGDFAAVQFPVLPDLGWTLSNDLSIIRLAVFELLAADFDADGDVDGADFLIWEAGFDMGSGASRAEGDADGDGDVDADDFVIWEDQFGSSAASGAALALNRAIPEPTTFMLSLSVVGFLMSFPKCRNRDLWRS